MCPLNPNTYTYVLGNPVVNIDMWGLETLCDALRYLAEREEQLGGPDAFADKVLDFSDYPSSFDEYYPPNHDANGNELYYGTGGENFMDAHGRMVDIQYVQAGFAATKKAGGINAILVFEEVSLLGLRSPPWAENNDGYKSNQLGTALGIKAASLGSMTALYEDMCNGCGE